MAKGGYIQAKVNSTTFEANMKNLSSKHRKEASYAAAKYLMGTPSRGLKKYPRYKYITRKIAYGKGKNKKTFKSESQRRYVMARIRSGDIDPGVPKRTGRMQRGWNVTRTRSGARVYNSEPHAIWSHDNQRQARLNKLVGWKQVEEIEEINRKGMNREAEKAIKELVK